MFTGIIQSIGTIASIDKAGDWRLTVATAMDLSRAAIGASIACAGVCLTVVEKSAGSFLVQASAETLSRTTLSHWRIGTRVNLEPALRLGDELGGHLVAGHVDAVVRLAARREEGDSLRLDFDAPAELARFIAPKGSAVIDGVSLTVNEVAGGRFGVNIIPHTRSATTLDALQPGDAANFEADMIARYLDRLLPK